MQWLVKVIGLSHSSIGLLDLFRSALGESGTCSI